MFSLFDQQCIDLLLAFPNYGSRVCFESALHHLECAQKIIFIDPAMAKFRVLTAEEEAASGLMYCLKEMSFSNSELLKPKDHKYKNGIIPFFRIFGLFFREKQSSIIQEPKLHIDEGVKKRLFIEFKMIVNGSPSWFRPEPPLGIYMGNTDGEAETFEDQINSFADMHGVKKVFDYIERQANVRNELLYAGKNGYPKRALFENNDFHAKEEVVLNMLKVYLLIRPYNKNELPFVQNSLDCYLRIINNR